MAVNYIANLPEGWTAMPLIECTEDKMISYGVVQPGQHVADGVPIIRVNNFSNGSLDISSLLKISPTVEQNYSRTRLIGGEVLLTLVGSTGQSAIAPEHVKGWNVARAIAVIRPNKKIGAKWINIILQSRATTAFLDAHANTTVQKTLNLKDVKQIPILIPPEKVKNFIVSCISTFDDKIELNRQMNATLESMAQAMFKSWFFDFDPVIDNALTAGNPIPEPLKTRAENRRRLGDQRKPLLQEIQKLFPDRFVFTEELGWIPEGWEAGILSDIAELKTQSIKPDKKPDKTWDHFSIPAFDENKIPHKDIGHSIKSGKYTVPKTAVLASKLNPQFPRVWLPEVKDENSSICSTEFMPFIPLKAEERSYLYTFFCSEKIQTEIANRVTGSTGSRQRVKPKEIAEMTILKAPQHIRAGFSNRVSSLFFKQANNINEQTLLTNIRDTLLPKLISGQLRLPDSLIEKFAKQASSHDAEQIISEAI